MEAGRCHYKKDCFVVWHPDTLWHPAFYAKVKDTPLPSTFMGESDCLDRLCIAIKTIRKGMRKQDRDPKKAPTFHVLIPSWYNIAITEPLHFPDELLPLRLAESALQASGNNSEKKLSGPDMAAGVKMATAASSWTPAVSVAFTPILVGVYRATMLAGISTGERLAECLCKKRPRVLGSRHELGDEDE
ncbi:hypothetical protein ACHAPV_006148 [Trichoderma viride]